MIWIHYAFQDIANFSNIQTVPIKITFICAKAFRLESL